MSIAIRNNPDWDFRCRGVFPDEQDLAAFWSRDRQAPFASASLRPPPRYAEHSIALLREAGVAPGTLAAWVREGAVVDLPSRDA